MKWFYSILAKQNCQKYEHILKNKPRKMICWAESNGRNEKIEKELLALSERLTNEPTDFYIDFEDSTKVLTGETLAKMRTTKMKNKIKKDCPLFYKEMITKELALNSKKYSIKECVKHQESRVEFLKSHGCKSYPKEKEMQMLLQQPLPQIG